MSTRGNASSAFGPSRLDRAFRNRPQVPGAESLCIETFLLRFRDLCVRDDVPKARCDFFLHLDAGQVSPVHTRPESARSGHEHASDDYENRGTLRQRVTLDGNIEIHQIGERDDKNQGLDCYVELVCYFHEFPLSWPYRHEKGVARG